ncbi:alpha/beta hydrolase [Edaphobacter paludis]|uniref:Alpha/beta hydrolase n=1 Tax=Edaphobacter paludis TaxID=3035702 RepID=A0AAU7D9Y1_9BACT
MVRFHLWRAGVKSSYVEAGGYRMHFFEAKPSGSAEGTPLLLVHGLGARGEDWAPMIPALTAKGFHVYAPDLLGYGRSAHPDASYSISMEEAAIVQFMQSVHLKRADVGGWSMGGWVTLKLALDHPEMVDRLVVYDSAGLYFPATFSPDLFMPTDVAEVRRLAATLTPKPLDMPGFVARAALRKLEGNAWVIRRSMTAMTNGYDLLDFRLNNMQRPVLIVWGAQDALIPLSVGETMHRDIPDSVLNVMEGCGHLAPAVCWKPVVRSTVDFLRAEPPMQGGEKTFPAEQ